MLYIFNTFSAIVSLLWESQLSGGKEEQIIQGLSIINLHRFFLITCELQYVLGKYCEVVSCCLRGSLGLLVFLLLDWLPTKSKNYLPYYLIHSWWVERRYGFMPFSRKSKRKRNRLLQNLNLICWFYFLRQFSWDSSHCTRTYFMRLI